jgi:CheY-like chemotaxis protein
MSDVVPPAPRAILYTEDDENDVFLMGHALKRAGVPHPLSVATDGQQAIDALADPARHGSPATMPAVVLLDLNLPRRSGFEVLKWIRSQPVFAELVVVILSSSNHKKDIDQALALGATAYFVKPANVNDRVQLIRVLQERWLRSTTA